MALEDRERINMGVKIRGEVRSHHGQVSMVTYIVL